VSLHCRGQRVAATAGTRAPVEPVSGWWPTPEARRIASDVRPQAQRLPIAARVGRHRLLGKHSTGGHGHHRQHVLDQVRVDTDDVVRSSASIPTDPPASLGGSGWAGLSTGKPRRQDGKESRPQGDKLLIKPASERQTGAAAHTQTDHSQGTHTAASHLTSHTLHGDSQAGDGPGQADPPSLTVARDQSNENSGGRMTTTVAAHRAKTGR
jgi:hypothetical protein